MEKATVEKRKTDKTRPEAPQAPRRILRIRAVKDRTGLSRGTLTKLQALGQFPARVILGPRSVGWYEDEVTRWIETRQRRPQ